MRRTTSATIAAVALAASLVLGACSGSSSDGDAKGTTTTEAKAPSGVDALTAADYQAAFAAKLSDGDDTEYSLDDTDATCVSTAWVEAIGVDRLHEADVSTDDVVDPDFEVGKLKLGLDTGQAMVKAFDDCEVDLVEQLATLLSDGNDERRDCVVATIDRAAFADVVARTFAGAKVGDSFDKIVSATRDACDGKAPAGG